MLFVFIIFRINELFLSVLGKQVNVNVYIYMQSIWFKVIYKIKCICHLNTCPNTYFRAHVTFLQIYFNFAVLCCVYVHGLESEIK